MKLNLIQQLIIVESNNCNGLFYEDYLIKIIIFKGFAMEAGNFYKFK